ASIEGIVTRLGSGEPISGAEVILRMTSAAFEPTPPAVAAENVVPFFPGRVPAAVTDRDGKFVFKDLNPGSYRITAARNGYVKQEYGQRILGGQGTVVNLVPGQVLK